MKLMKLVVFAFVWGAVLLAGCNAEEDVLTEIKFNRGHGSAWGNQFYIEINAQEIVTAQYIPEGTGEMVTVEHVLIMDTQWQALKTVAEQLPLEKARTDLWEKHKLDGSEYRELTLIYGTKETTYWWPNVPEAQQLELLLENLLDASI